MTGDAVKKETRSGQDEVMQEVRAIREAYAARFGYDVRALLAHARKQAQQSGREVVKREPRRIEGPRSS
ncbi:MAG: hypothetical protein ACR2GR_00210 [Rhodothermales bacterium]